MVCPRNLLGASDFIESVYRIFAGKCENICSDSCLSFKQGNSHLEYAILTTGYVTPQN